MNQPIINVTAKALAHIAERHVPGGAETALTSVVNPGESILGLVRAAEGQIPVYQATTGNLIRTVDARRLTGISKWTGEPASVYTS